MGLDIIGRLTNLEIWNVNVLLRHVRLPWSKKGVKETKGMGGGKEFETTKNGVAQYTIASRIQFTDYFVLFIFFFLLFIYFSISFFLHMYFIMYYIHKVVSFSSVYSLENRNTLIISNCSRLRGRTEANNRYR